jgi:hypothetical protein
MTSGDRLGDGNIGDPNIRDGGIQDPDIRDGGIEDPNIRDGGVQDPNLRDGGITDPNQRTISDPDIRPGEDVAIHDVNERTVGDPDIRDGGIGDPDLAPQPMSGGIPIIPIAIIGGLLVVAIAAFSFLSGGAPSATSRPGGSAAAGATTGAGANPTSKPASSGITSGSGNPQATLELSGGLIANYTLDGPSANVSPTAPLIAAIWTETVDNVAEGYGELITVTLAGPVFSGTRGTNNETVLSFTVSRIDASGNDIFQHQWVSKAGECQVTMSTGTAISGTFECATITSGDGITVTARGTYTA